MNESEVRLPKGDQLILKALVEAFGFTWAGYREVEEEGEFGTWQEVALTNPRDGQGWFFYLDTESYEWAPRVSRVRLEGQDDIEGFSGKYEPEEDSFISPLVRFLYDLREGKINATT